MLSLAIAVTVGVVIGITVGSDTDSETVSQDDRATGSVEQRKVEEEIASVGIPEAVTGQKEVAGSMDFRDALSMAMRQPDMQQSWIEFYLTLNK